MEKRIIYVGLDVHKDTIAVALTEAGKRGEFREHGKIANTPAAVKTLATKLARDDAAARRLIAQAVEAEFEAFLSEHAELGLPDEAVVLPMTHAKQLIRPFTTVARPMQKRLAFRSKGSIGVVVRRGERA